MSQRFDQTRGRSLLAVAAVAVLLAAWAGALPALAQATPSPHWRLESRSAPTNLPLKGEGLIEVTAVNLGSADVEGQTSPVTFTDTLPAGLEETEVTFKRYNGGLLNKPTAGSCSDAPGSPLVVCTMTGKLSPYQVMEIRIRVRVNLAVASEPVNAVTVTGGGAPTELLRRPLKVNGDPTSFGVEQFELTPENENGTPDTQAGSHPFQLTTTFNLNQTYELGPVSKKLEPSAPALERNLSFKLPAGLIGDANVNAAEDNPVGQCPEIELPHAECPDGTAVGAASVAFYETSPVVAYETLPVPVFNLVPAPGEPARFGFEVAGVPVILNTSVRTGEGYGVTVSIDNNSQTIDLLASTVTFWGVPGSPAHDDARGWECLGEGSWTTSSKPCEPKDPTQPEPFLTLPTSCGPLTSAVEGEAWNTDSLVGPLGELSIAGESPTTLTGCKELPFKPSVQVTPDEHRASTPTGLTVEVKVPQETTLAAGENAEAGVRATTIELPEGIQASPAAAGGLETCSVGLAGFDGLDSATGSLLAGELEAQRFTDADAACPSAAKIGTVAIKTPLLAEELTGSVYMASQDTNPFASPLVLYLVAEEPVSKVLVKLAGEVTLNPVTGQLISTFKNTPPLPFESLKLHLFNSERSSQSTPPLCGTYTTNASLEPWSGNAAVSAPSTFQISEGADGGPCENSFPQSFAPSFQAGSTSTQAAGFTSFTLTIEHPDADQPLNGITMQLPPGLAGILANVTPCAEPAAGQPWDCGPQSLLGTSSASSGLGSEPYTLPGSVYLTAGYDGAPFGLLDATEAKAGPFNLGMVYVRSKIEVNPHTAAVSVTTDPGPHGDVFPTILKGVPVQLKQLNVTIDRPEFQFNPTNCSSMAVTGTLSGSQGASEAVSSPFQATNCASLPFKPVFTAQTHAGHTRRNGDVLKVGIASGLGQANIAKVHVTLPKDLPSRLETLKQACTEAQFAANPGGCPAASMVGTVTVHTPVLANALTGPAIFVSHGHAAFPNLDLVLQGEGITIIQEGETFVSESGYTSNTFASVPDTPFSSFELTLPAGPYSALAGEGNLCKKPEDMATKITGQNGAVIEQKTLIKVTGCSTAFKVRSHKVKRRTLTLKVQVPAAGKLEASGKGLTSESKSSTGSETLTLKLKARKQGKLNTKVKLVFKPKTGKKRTKSLKVKFRK